MDPKNNIPNTPGNETPSPRKLVRRLEGAKRLGRSPSMIHEYLRPASRYYRPDFPQLVKLGRGSFFYEDELNAYIAGLPRARAIADPKGLAADETAKKASHTRSSKNLTPPSIRPPQAIAKPRAQSVRADTPQIAPDTCSPPNAEAEQANPTSPPPERYRKQVFFTVRKRRTYLLSDEPNVK
jgi:predicted DNA-binding transcriptional regulator AlpA